jgi:hypothetical protein
MLLTQRSRRSGLMTAELLSDQAHYIQGTRTIRAIQDGVWMGLEERVGHQRRIFTFEQIPEPL